VVDIHPAAAVVAGVHPAAAEAAAIRRAAVTNRDDMKAVRTRQGRQL